MKSQPKLIRKLPSHGLLALTLILGFASTATADFTSAIKIALKDRASTLTANDRIKAISLEIKAQSGSFIFTPSCYKNISWQGRERFESQVFRFKDLPQTMTQAALTQLATSAANAARDSYQEVLDQLLEANDQVRPKRCNIQSSATIIVDYVAFGKDLTYTKEIELDPRAETAVYWADQYGYIDMLYDWVNERINSGDYARIDSVNVAVTATSDAPFMGYFGGKECYANWSFIKQTPFQAQDSVTLKSAPQDIRTAQIMLEDLAPDLAAITRKVNKSVSDAIVAANHGNRPRLCRVTTAADITINYTLLSKEFTYTQQNPLDYKAEYAAYWSNETGLIEALLAGAQMIKTGQPPGKIVAVTLDLKAASTSRIAGPNCYKEWNLFNKTPYSAATSVTIEGSPEDGETYEAFTLRNATTIAMAVKAINDDVSAQLTAAGGGVRMPNCAITTSMGAEITYVIVERERTQEIAEQEIDNQAESALYWADRLGLWEQFQFPL